MYSTHKRRSTMISSNNAYMAPHLQTDKFHFSCHTPPTQQTNPNLVKNSHETRDFPWLSIRSSFYFSTAFLSYSSIQPEANLQTATITRFPCTNTHPCSYTPSHTHGQHVRGFIKDSSRIRWPIDYVKYTRGALLEAELTFHIHQRI